MHSYGCGKVAFMRVGKYETSDKSSTGTAVTFLMIGIGAGALIALLLAPKTGKQMRKDIRRKYDDARDALQEHGLLVGLALTVRRLVKCGPWHPGGLDPVPQKKCLRVESYNISKPTTTSCLADLSAIAPRATAEARRT